MKQSKDSLHQLSAQAEELVVAVEKLDLGEAFNEPATVAREAVARLRDAARLPLFPPDVVPVNRDVVEGWTLYSEGTEDYSAGYGARAASLHGAALRSFPELAVFGRGPVIRARVRRAGGNLATPRTEAPEPGALVRPLENAAQAASRGADEAELTYMEACARAIAAQDVPAVADLVPYAAGFVTSCDLERRLAATLEPRQTHAKAEAERIERAAHEAEAAISEARRTSLVQFFEALGEVVFEEVTSVSGVIGVPGTVTASTIARALASGRLGPAGHADELVRAEALRASYLFRVRRQHERAEQLIAATATK